MTPSDILEPFPGTRFAAGAATAPGTTTGPAPSTADAEARPKAGGDSDSSRSDYGRTGYGSPKDWRAVPTAAVSFVIHPHRLLKAFGIGIMALCFLGFVQACLAAVNGEASAWTFGRLFGLNYSGNLLAWFAGVALFSCAWLLGLLAALARSSGDPLFKDWRMLTILVALLSMDEVASIHQAVLEPLRKLSGETGYFEYGWVAFSFVLLAVLWKWLYPFLSCSPPVTRTEFIVAFGFYFLGMLGMGLTGAVYSETSSPSGSFAVMTLLNQFFQMLGILLFLRALLHHVADFAPRFHIRLERS